MRAGKPRLRELVRVRLRSASDDRAPCVAMQHYNNGNGGWGLPSMGVFLGSGGGERDAAAVMRVYMYIIIYVCVLYDYYVYAMIRPGESWASRTIQRVAVAVDGRRRRRPGVPRTPLAMPQQSPWRTKIHRLCVSRARRRQPAGRSRRRR